jgi:hypothetical protein
MTELSQVLIVFSHEQGPLRQDVITDTDPAEAFRAYDATARQVAAQAQIEVALIGCDSLDTCTGPAPTTSTASPPWNASSPPGAGG